MADSTRDWDTFTVDKWDNFTVDEWDDFRVDPEYELYYYYYHVICNG